jgi:hypothetical protein
MTHDGCMTTCQGSSPLTCILQGSRLNLSTCPPHMLLLLQVAHQVDLLDSRVKQEQQSILSTLQALLTANSNSTPEAAAPTPTAPVPGVPLINIPVTTESHRRC